MIDYFVSTINESIVPGSASKVIEVLLFEKELKI